MKIHYLGTAAAEGFPAVFCNCNACNAAREAGGRNIRTRSQMLIDDCLLVDFPCDTYAHALTHGIRLDAVKYLLVTHSHGDHFYPGELEMRGIAFAHDLRSPVLSVLSGSAVCQKYKAIAEGFHSEVRKNIDWTPVEPFKEYQLGEYTIIPLPANHMREEQALIYVISGKGKTLLYGNDTGYPYPEVFEFIRTDGLRFDMLSLDCTMVTNPVPDSGTHMGFDGCARTVRQLAELGALNPGCRVVATHFSHNGNPMHDRLSALGNEYGMEIAYDGFTLNL